MQSSLRAKGYSRAAAAAIAKAHRPSTVALYDDKWGTFVTYSAKKKQDPLTASPQFVADFLLHLRSKRKLKGGTLATYLSAINTVLAVKNGSSVAKVPELVALIKSLKKEDQANKAKLRPPAWDLNVVLKALRSRPYEPLANASLEALTRKTAFLLALATAARVSELHALDVTRVKFQTKRHGNVLLGLAWDFLAKNQLPGQPDRQFSLTPLSSIVGSEDEEELLLCPVRTLREYIKRTKATRGTRKKLFIPIKATSGEVSKNTVSFWLRSTILGAYQDAGLPPPAASNPHEIRAVSSTMALHSNCSLSAIMEGCFWKSSTVFSSHYLRDIAVEDVAGVQSFGPLIVAQQLTRPPRRK